MLASLKSSLQQPHVGGTVRNKHVPRDVRNGEGNFTGYENGLRRHSASVKDGNFIGTDLNRVTPVGRSHAINANGCRTPDTNWSAVGMRKLARYLNFLGHHGAFNGFH